MHSWAIAIIALVTIGYAAVSRRLDRTVLTAPIVFVAAGLAFGSAGTGWIDLELESGRVRLIVEAALTFVLFADASRIDLRALRREYVVPARLLGIGLPLTIAAGMLIALAVLRQLTLAEALLLAIVLAPTDAALGQAVVTDERLPSRIRQGLNVESGLNDGLCVPLLFIALAIARAGAGALSMGAAIQLVLEQIGWGIAGGVVAGLGGALVVRHAARRGLVTSEWLQVIPGATAVLAYGIAAPLGGSGFIAAFVGGLAFGALHRSTGGEVMYLVDEVGLVLSAFTFVVFGALILGRVLGDVTWPVVAVAVLSLTVARMLPVAVSMLGTHARPPTVAYLGWFGPRGLASIVFGVLILEAGGLPHLRVLLLTTVVTIAISVLAHGLSAKPLTERYVQWYQTHPNPRMERVPAAEQRWRRSRAEPVVARDGVPRDSA